jgi:hypothetical protein
VLDSAAWDSVIVRVDSGQVTVAQDRVAFPGALLIGGLGQAKRCGNYREHEGKATAYHPGLHKSLVPVSDSASSQVIGREFQRHAIAIHDLDAITAQSPRHGG